MNSQSSGSKILLIGDKSYLAQAFLSRSVHQLNIITQRRFDESALDWSNISVVINFSLNPLYRCDPYSQEIDSDLEIINAIHDKPIHYIMLSSRLVYMPDQGLALTEMAAVGRDNEYAKNKIVTEAFLREAMPTRHSILRLGNIFDFEMGRPTFFGIALTSLKLNNEIVINFSLDTRRDFLPVPVFCSIIDQILSSPPPGTFNLASGKAMLINDIGQSIIQGFGKGELRSTSSVIKDAFSLDITKISDLLGLEITEADVLSAAHRIGKLLKHA